MLPAKLRGVRASRDSVGQDIAVNINLIEKISDTYWVVLARPGRRLKVDDRIQFSHDFSAQVISKLDGGKFELRLEGYGKPIQSLIEKYGAMPLPPYIDRRRSSDDKDKVDYQTILATGDANSVAAPTASLHFTPRLLDNIDKAGLVRHTVKLHVGFGTFAPLNDKHFDENTLHPEWIELDQDTAVCLNVARNKGSRIIAIGTTAMRTIETCVNSDGVMRTYLGNTDIFLKPGDKILATDGLLSNFHLPKSSLFLLVCALMGRETMQAAYSHAIRAEYRFFSYGDACLLLP